MWFRNLIVYTLPPQAAPDPDTLAAGLATQAFVPGGGLDATSTGWAPPLETDASLVWTVGRQMLVTLRQERKLLPAQVIIRVVRERAQRIEETEGFKPGRKRMKELKDEVRDELLPRAFTLSADTRVWIDPVAGRLAIDTVSAARADEAIGLLIRAVDGLAPRPLKTAASPAGEMTAWLATGQPPAGFTIDQDAELRARDGKATVRFANQSLDREDIARHTGAGKQCTKLALTWAERVAFVLTDRLEIRRIRPQDVLREEAGSPEGDAAERLAADMTLMTGELARLLDDVTEALGGPQPA